MARNHLLITGWSVLAVGGAFSLRLTKRSGIALTGAPQMANHHPKVLQAPNDIRKRPDEPPSRSRGEIASEPGESHEPVQSASEQRRDLENWATRDPLAAAEWLRRNTTEPLASDWRPVMEIWTRVDPAAAGEWLNSLEKGPAFDSATAAFVDVLGAEQPILATRWALEIGNPIEQTRALSASLTGWFRKDPAAALKWSENAGLPPNLLGLPADSGPAPPALLLPSIMEN